MHDAMECQCLVADQISNREYILTLSSHTFLTASSSAFLTADVSHLLTVIGLSYVTCIHDNYGVGVVYRSFKPHQRLHFRILW